MAMGSFLYGKRTIVLLTKTNVSGGEKNSSFFLERNGSHYRIESGQTPISYTTAFPNVLGCFLPNLVSL